MKVSLVFCVDNNRDRRNNRYTRIKTNITIIAGFGNYILYTFEPVKLFM